MINQYSVTLRSTGWGEIERLYEGKRTDPQTKEIKTIEEGDPVAHEITMFMEDFLERHPETFQLKLTAKERENDN